MTNRLLFVLPECRYESQRPARFIRKVGSVIMEVVENELFVALSQQGRMHTGPGEASRV